MSNSKQDPTPQPILNEAIDDILVQMRSGNQNTKRRHLRHEAEGLIVYIASNYEPGKVPPQTDFFPVRCCNLSCSGVSFFSPSQPDFEKLVVQLGTEEDGIYMESEVIHVDPIRSIPEGDFALDCNGQRHEIRPTPKTFEIGCQFQQRIPVE